MTVRGLLNYLIDSFGPFTGFIVRCTGPDSTKEIRAQEMTESSKTARSVTKI